MTRAFKKRQDGRLSVTEAAKIRGLRVTTAFRLARSGRLPGCEWDGKERRFLVSEATLRPFLDSPTRQEVLAPEAEVGEGS